MNDSIIISILISENKKLESDIKKLRDEKDKLKRQSNMFEIKTYRIPFFSSSRASKARLRSDIKKTIVSLNIKLKLANLTVKNIKLVEANNKSYENECDFIEISPIIETDLSTEKLLYIKDRLLISDKKYDSLNKELRIGIPSISKIKSYRKVINENIKRDLIKIGNGYFVDAKNSIYEYCLKFLHFK